MGSGGWRAGRRRRGARHVGTLRPLRTPCRRAHRQRLRGVRAGPPGPRAHVVVDRCRSRGVEWHRSSARRSRRATHACDGRADGSTGGVVRPLDGRAALTGVRRAAREGTRGSRAVRLTRSCRGHRDDGGDGAAGRRRGLGRRAGVRAQRVRRRRRVGSHPVRLAQPRRGRGRRVHRRPVLRREPSDDVRVPRGVDDPDTRVHDGPRRSRASRRWTCRSS